MRMTNFYGHQSVDDLSVLNEVEVIFNVKIQIQSKSKNGEKVSFHVRIIRSQSHRHLLGSVLDLTISIDFTTFYYFQACKWL